MFNAEKLRIYRKASGMTQADLARLAGCERNTVSRVEIGKLRPSHDLARRLADALEVDPASLHYDADALANPPAHADGSGEPAADSGGPLSPLERRIVAVVRQLNPQAQGEILGIALARAAGVPLEQVLGAPPENPG